MADFDVQGARKAGYTDAEIADHLAGMRKFDATAARQAGYGDKEIIDHLSPGPGMLQRGMNAVGDTFKAVDDWGTTRAANAAGALVSLPGVAAKGSQWIGRQLGIDPQWLGPQYAKVLDAMTEHPTGEQISGDILKAGGKTPSNLPGGLGKIVDTGVEGALGAVATGGATWPAMMSGAFGGAGSETLGQVAQSVAPEWETEARLFGALGGGVGGAVAPSVVRKTVDAGKATVVPFTPGGREKIAGATLRSAASDPDEAIAALQRYQIGKEAFPDAVPGFKIDAGRASRDPGLMATAEVAIPDKVRGLQVQRNNALATGALDDAFAGLPAGTDAGSTIQKVLADRFKQGVDARSNASSPLYEQVRASPLPVDPTDAWMVARTVADEGKGKPAATMGKVAGYFESGANTPAKLDATRKAVGALLENPKLDKYSKSLLLEVRGKIDDAMSVIPEEQAARSTFQQHSKPLEPFADKTAAGNIVKKDRFGKDFVMPADKVTGDLSGKAVQNIVMAAGGDPVVKKALQSAFFEDFKKSALSANQLDAAGNPTLQSAGASKWLAKNKGAAANVLTADQLKALDDVASNLRDQAQTVPGRTGSPTFDRLATQSILGALVGKRFGDAPILHPVRKALGLVYGGADEAVMQVVMEAIADPKVATALMKKATPGNVKMLEPMLQSIGRGAALPVSTAGERGSP